MRRKRTVPSSEEIYVALFLEDNFTKFNVQKVARKSHYIIKSAPASILSYLLHGGRGGGGGAIIKSFYL